jgi:ketosteroid isomerase-like protein
VLVLLSGCESDEGPIQGAPAPGSALAAGLLAEVMEADRAFARAVAEQGLEAWVAAFSQDGAMIPPSGPVMTGHEAIREAMAGAFRTPGFAVSWDPVGGDVARSGDLAYTFGDYQHSVDSKVITRGRYVTVWRRVGDSDWLVIADIGNRE